MEHIILFRFHQNSDLCCSRLQEIKNHHPNTPIYGVGENINGIEKLLQNGLEHNYVITDKSDRWKWKNGDYVMKKWFDNYGCTISFDRLTIIEWDMVLTTKINNTYENIDENTVVMVNVEPYNNTTRNWITGRKNEIYYLINEMNLSIKNPLIGLFPGTSIPRRLLKKYPQGYDNVGTDEIRLSLFAQGKFNLETHTIPTDYFNTQQKEIPVQRINNNPEIGVFHPVYQKIDNQQ